MLHIQGAPRQVLVHTTAGLRDPLLAPATTAANVRAIEESFVEPGDHIIVCALKLVDDRISAEDVACYAALRDAFDFDPASVVFVLHRLRCRAAHRDTDVVDWARPLLGWDRLPRGTPLNHALIGDELDGDAAADTMRLSNIRAALSSALSRAVPQRHVQVADINTELDSEVARLSADMRTLGAVSPQRATAAVLGAAQESAWQKSASKTWWEALLEYQGSIQAELPGC